MLNLVKTMHNAISFPKSNVSDLSSAEISVELDRLTKIIVFKVLRNSLRRTRERGTRKVAQWLRGLAALSEDLGQRGGSG